MTIIKRTIAIIITTITTTVITTIIMMSLTRHIPYFFLLASICLVLKRFFKKIIVTMPLPSLYFFNYCLSYFPVTVHFFLSTKLLAVQSHVTMVITILLTVIFPPYYYYFAKHQSWIYAVCLSSRKRIIFFR
jgi:hypothetical protein